MEEKRIASYMSVSTLCAVLCCAAAAYLLFQNAVNSGSMYENMLRPAISLLAAFVLFRHFAVRYRLRIRNKPLWVKLTAAFLYSALLAAVLTAFSALCVFMIVNRALWDDPIPYTVFLRKELTAWPLRSFNWNAPVVLLAVEGLYVFICESKIIMFFIFGYGMKLTHTPHNFVECKIRTPGGTSSLLRIFPAIGNKTIFLFCLKFTDKSFKMLMVFKIHLCDDFCKHIKSFFCPLAECFTNQPYPVTAAEIVSLVLFCLCLTLSNSRNRPTESSSPDISHYTGRFCRTLIPALTIPAKVSYYICKERKVLQVFRLQLIKWE